MKRYLPVFGFFLYLFLTLSHQYGPRLSLSVSHSLQYGQIIGLSFFYFFSLITLIKNKDFKFELDNNLIFFICAFFISSIFSYELKSIIWSSIYFVNCILLSKLLSHSSKNLFKFFVPFTFLIFTSLLFQLILYGIDVGRWVGNFRPVNFASIGFFIGFLGFFGSKNFFLRIFIPLICFIFTSIVIARGILITGFIFFIIYLLINSYFNRWLKSLIVYFSLFGILLSLAVIIFVPNAFIYLDILFDYLDITDPNRGFGSGFTGRTEKWKLSYEIFKSNPIFGIGYGLNSDSHSGFLQLLSEMGLFGLFSYLVLIIKAIYNAFSSLNQKYSHTVNCAFSFLISFQFYALIERQLINFGYPQGIIFLLVIIFCLQLPKSKKYYD